MSNDYFNKADVGNLARNTKARADDVNSRMDAIEDGFDKLPNPHAEAPGTKGFSEVYRITDATRRDHPPSVGQIQDQGTVYAADSGSANTYVVTLVPALAAYVAGAKVRFKATAANTGASTLNVSALGAKNILKTGGGALAAADIGAGMIVECTYDGAQFQISGSYSTLSVAVPVSITNGGTGQITATAAFTALKQIATLTASGVVELATDAEAIAGTDDARAITAASLLAYLKGTGVYRENLITNSAFIAESNSTLLAQGTETLPCTANVCIGRGLAPNNTCTTPSADTEADVTTGWTNVGWNTFASDTESTEPDGAHSLHLTATGNQQTCRLTSAMTTAVDKLYQLNVVYKVDNGATGAQAAVFGVGTSALGSDIGQKTDAFSTSWATWTLNFIATTTNCHLYIQEGGSGNDVELYIDQVSLHEVTSGTIAADAKAADGWINDTNMKTRQRISDDVGFTKSTYYCQEILSSVGNNLDSYQKISSPDVESLRGKPFTAGCGVVTSAVGRAELIIRTDGTGGTTTSAVNTTTNEEWLEATVTIPLDATYIDVGVGSNTADAAAVFFGSIIAVRGSSIGAWNYSRPVIEIISLESPITLANYNATAKSSASNVAISLEVESSGKLGKGLKAANTRLSANDSASGGSNSAFGLGADVSVLQELVANIGTAGLTLANNDIFITSGWVNCNSSGDIEAEIVSAAGGLDATVIITAIRN